MKTRKIPLFAIKYFVYDCDMLAHNCVSNAHTSITNRCFTSNYFKKAGFFRFTQTYSRFYFRRSEKHLFGSLSHLLQNIGHLFPLPLGSNVIANTFLQEFQTSLVLGNSQQLHGSLFVGGESSDFTNQITDELVVSGEFTLKKLNI